MGGEWQGPSPGPGKIQVDLAALGTANALFAFTMVADFLEAWIVPRLLESSRDGSGVSQSVDMQAPADAQSHDQLSAF